MRKFALCRPNKHLSRSLESFVFKRLNESKGCLNVNTEAGLHATTMWNSDAACQVTVKARSFCFRSLFLLCFYGFFYTPGQVGANVDKECRVRRTSDCHWYLNAVLEVFFCFCCYLERFYLWIYVNLVLIVFIIGTRSASRDECCQNELEFLGK